MLAEKIVEQCRLRLGQVELQPGIGVEGRHAEGIAMRLCIIDPAFRLQHGVVDDVTQLLAGDQDTTFDTVRLRVISCYLKVPEAFTPNGDGMNDYFTVFVSLEEYEIKIFNRWGEMVYHSQDPTELSDLHRGWDGTYK